MAIYIHSNNVIYAHVENSIYREICRKVKYSLFDKQPIPELLSVILTDIESILNRYNVKILKATYTLNTILIVTAHTSLELITTNQTTLYLYKMDGTHETIQFDAYTTEELERKFHAIINQHF